MSFSLIAHTKGASPNTNSVTSPGIDTTGANLLIAVIGELSTAGSPCVMSDSKSNTWHSLTTKATTLSRCTIFWSTPSSVGASHTFTATGSGNFPSICVQAWSGALTPSPFDVENGAVNSSTSSLATGSVTPSQDNELVVAAFGATESYSSITLSFTLSDSQAYSGGVNLASGAAYLVETTATAKNPTWSFTGGPSDAAAAIATFKYQPPSTVTGQMFSVF